MTPRRLAASRRVGSCLQAWSIARISGVHCCRRSPKLASSKGEVTFEASLKGLNTIFERRCLGVFRLGGFLYMDFMDGLVAACAPPLLATPGAPT